MWMAFDQREPIGDWRADLGFGIVASTIANANRAEGTKAFAPIDFMLLAEKQPERVPTAAEIRAMLKGVPVQKPKG